MTDSKSRTERLLGKLYAAAEYLLDAVTDPVALEEAPLNHRTAALAAVDKFIDRLEKRVAAKPKWDDDTVIQFVFPDEDDETDAANDANIVGPKTNVWSTPQWKLDYMRNAERLAGLADDVAPTGERMSEFISHQIRPYPPQPDAASATVAQPSSN